jgi:hypothetical protein
MTQRRSDPPVRVRELDAAPADWDRFLTRVPGAELAACARWTELAARHYPGGRACWLIAESDAGDLLGGIPLLGRCRWQQCRLESSFDGMVAGPQIAADLPQPRQEEVHAALCRGLLARLGGRTTLVAFTVAAEVARRRAAALTDTGSWQAVPFRSAVVDCRVGLEIIERERWTNNRRNERNRGLKRGCTLQIERGQDVLAAWYPIYLAQAASWLQAPVPRGFLQDLLTHLQPHAFLVTVRLAGRLVGGHYCLVSRGRLVPFLSGADPELARTHFLHTLLYWQDIVEACAAGLAAVDFGGCAERDSLWDFKRRCGGEPEPRLQLQARSPVGTLLRQVAVLRRRWRKSDA